VTAQGLLNSTTSLAGVVSSLLTGWLFDWLSPNGLYSVMAGCCLAALVIFGAGSWFIRQGKHAETIEIT
jgi:hypothetical protein